MLDARLLVPLINFLADRPLAGHVASEHVRLEPTPAVCETTAYRRLSRRNHAISTWSSLEAIR